MNKKTKPAFNQEAFTRDIQEYMERSGQTIYSLNKQTGINRGTLSSAVTWGVAKADTLYALARIANLNLNDYHNG